MKSFSFRLFSPCLVLIASTLFAVQAHAKDYLVEIIVFETVAGRKLSAGGLHYPKVGKSIQIDTAAATELGFVSIDEGKTLTENASAMAASGKYRVLRHMAWRQPGLDTEAAIAVRIGMGNRTQVFLPENISNYEQFIPASASPTIRRPREVTTFTVNGTIKVRLGRFLHMETLLVFTDPDTGQGFRLAQNRKMRSRELHYIDNPRFGVLTRILPLDDVLVSTE